MADSTVREHIVFVYGTLLSGLGNHHYLDGAHYFGEAETVESYRMTAGGIPYVSRRDPICPVKGELYIVNDETLAKLDRLEGHPRFYKREVIHIRIGKGHILAWCYLNERSAGHHVVEDGDYRRVAKALGMGV